METSKRVVRVATWNIGGGILGDSHQTSGKEYLEYHADLLRLHQPDIVCLQECHHSENSQTNQVSRLAETLNYQYSKSTPISPSHLDPDAELALGIMTSYPIRNIKYTRFRNPCLTATGPKGQQWTLFDKGYCSYEVELAEETIAITNAHCFPLHYFSATATEDRFKDIWNDLGSHLKESENSRPTLAAIDLNFPFIKNVLSDEIIGPRYINAFDATPTTPKGIQQDYILYSRQFRLLTTHIIPTRSDHHLCICDFSFER